MMFDLSVSELDKLQIFFYKWFRIILKQNLAMFLCFYDSFSRFQTESKNFEMIDTEVWQIDFNH